MMIIFFNIVGVDFTDNTDNTQMQQIMFTSCDRTKPLTLTIENDQYFESDENIHITLINVTLTSTMENRSDIVLSEEERGRLVINMTETTITILDDDGKSSIIIQCYIL